MTDVQGRFALYVPVNGMEEDARWSQTDPRATLALNYDDPAAVGTLTLPAGMVPDCAGVYDIKGPAYMFVGTLAPVHVDPSVDIEVALHLEFDVPDLGRPLEVGLTLSSRAVAEFLPGWTSSLDINPKLTVPVGASNPNAGFTATSLFTDPENHGANLAAGHHVWDLTVKMRMGQYQIGATFDLSLYSTWDVPTPLAPLAAGQVVTSTVTATVTAGAVPTGPPPVPPAAVRYRDPADGQFKPLSQIGAKGYPVPPPEAPDYSQAGIRFVDHPLTTGAAAVGTVPGGWQQPDNPSEAGGTVTAVEGGMRYQMNAPGGGTTFNASAEALIVPPLPITHADERTYSFVSTAAVASWNANGGLWSMNLYLISDGGSANIGTVQQTGGEIRPSSPIGAATLKAIMDGANLRVRAMVTVSVFSGVAPAFVADVTLTNFRIHAQEVVAP